MSKPEKPDTPGWDEKQILICQIIATLDQVLSTTRAGLATWPDDKLSALTTRWMRKALAHNSTPKGLAYLMAVVGLLNMVWGFQLTPDQEGGAE